jgi:hypothetical protein
LMGMLTSSGSRAMCTTVAATCAGSIIRYDDVDEAVAMANRLDDGLCASV